MYVPDPTRVQNHQSPWDDDDPPTPPAPTPISNGPLPAAADDVGPQFLVSGRAGLPHDRVEEVLRDAFKTRPVFLPDLLRRGNKPKTAPTIGLVEGSEHGLLFKGQSHSVSATPGKGKTMGGQHIMRELARQGVVCAHLDFEKDEDAFVERMEILSVVDEPETAANIAYWKIRRPLHTVLPMFLRFCVKYGVEFVLLDSVGSSMTAARLNYNENDNNHVRDWYDRNVEPMLLAGLTVLMVDHLGRSAEQRENGRYHKQSSDVVRFSKGATDKLSKVTGAAYVAITEQDFSRKQAGYARWINAKCNSGFFTELETVAEFHVTPVNGGETVVTEFRAPTPTPVGEYGKPVDPKVPTVANRSWLMSKICEFLEQHPDGVPKVKIKANVGKGNEFVQQALDLLIGLGCVSVTPGARGALVHKLVKPFVFDDGNPF